MSRCSFTQGPTVLTRAAFDKNISRLNYEQSYQVSLYLSNLNNTIDVVLLDMSAGTGVLSPTSHLSQSYFKTASESHNIIMTGESSLLTIAFRRLFENNDRRRLCVLKPKNIYNL